MWSINECFFSFEVQKGDVFLFCNNHELLFVVTEAIVSREINLLKQKKNVINFLS